MKTRLYRHYKNKTYKYLGLVRHSETLEEMALYETLYENDLGQVWVRPKEMYFGATEVNGKLLTRFTPVDLQCQLLEVIDAKASEIISRISHSCGVSYEKHKTNEEMILLQIVYDGNDPVAFKLGYAKDMNVFVAQLTAVLPKYQHLGIATGLSEQQQQWAHKNKFSKLRSYLFNKNLQMLRLNLKMGFHIVNIDSENQIVLDKNI